jgi:guanylate kinase
MTDAEFDAAIRAGRLFEDLPFGRIRYGMLLQDTSYEHLIIQIGLDGCLAVKAAFPFAKVIWINPPGSTIDAKLEVLQRRLERRGLEGPGTIKRLLDVAAAELVRGPRLADYVVTNPENHPMLAARTVVSLIRKMK